MRHFSPDVVQNLPWPHLVIFMLSSTASMIFMTDISLAARELGWQPTIGLQEGLQRTIADFDARLKRGEKVE